MDATTFALRHPIFTTRWLASMTDARVDVVSRRLGRLARRGAFVKVTRGIWAQPDHPRFTPYAAVGFLLGNEQGCVSFISALRLHGVLAQMPGAIHVATTGHSRVLESPIGRFEFRQLRPLMMAGGIEMSETDPPYPVATAEKALIDTLYVATRRGRRFARLPELNLEAMDPLKLRILLDSQVTARPISRAISARLESLGVLSREQAATS